MTKAPPDKLKLLGETGSREEQFDLEQSVEMPALCEAFSEATGWPLQFESGSELRQDPVLKWSVPVNPGLGVTLGHLRIGLGANSSGSAERGNERRTSERLATQLAGVLGQLAAAQRAVCDREAELAAGVPVVARADEPKQLSSRLRAVLKAGAKAAGVKAAALYMLDESTTELKLRAAWGLPVNRLLQPARPLEGAIADLEALLGHAVALERATSFGPWHVPEKFPAALCVPVSTSSTPLGTMWFFSNCERDFSEADTGLAELTAGRLAAELERAVLVTAQLDSTAARREIEAARRLQQSQLPQPIRLAEEGWELAGDVTASGQLSGAFYDWTWVPGDVLAIVVGEAGQSDISGALTAAALRSAVRTYVEQGVRSPSELIDCLNRALWLLSGGDESASLVFGIMDLPAGKLTYSWAGSPAAMHFTAGAKNISLAPRPPLGRAANALFPEQTLNLAPGDSLVLANRGFEVAGAGASRRVAGARPKGSPGEPAAALHDSTAPATLLNQLKSVKAERPAKQGQALLAIKRTSPSRSNPPRSA